MALRRYLLMKLNERNDYPKLNINKDIKEPLNTQGFNYYSMPLTGVEVEVENFTTQLDPLPSHSWRVETDGSLRNRGVEFISKPTEPKHIESAITYLFDDILNQRNHFSPRTSIHVHLNCRELTFDQVYNIVILYQCFEDLLYSFAGPERKKSIFCIPVGNTDYYNALKTLMKAETLPTWSKYTGLNLGPLREYGTIEFRHLRGTRNKFVVFDWLHILYKLYTFAISLETEELEKLIHNTTVSHDYFGLGYAVFGTHFLTLTRDASYEKTMKTDMTISRLFSYKKPNLEGYI